MSSVKKCKVAKKTKRVWRKHVDMKDVDAFLDDQRLEERLGAPFSERKDEDLFTYDRDGDGDNKLADSCNLTKQQRRQLLKNSEPKCFAILKPHTAVPDPIVKRNRVRTPEERKSILIKNKEALRLKSGKLNLKEKLAIKNRQLAEKKRAAKPVKGEFNIDVWNKKPVVEQELKSEWLNKETVNHTFANTGRKLKRIPESVYQKPSVISAITAPHPGISYNPSYADHQKLLQAVAADELKLMKKEKHLDRVTSQMFRKVSPKQQEKENFMEMSEGLPIHPESNVEKMEDNDDDDGIVKSVNPPVKNQKKTLVERRKIKERQKIEQEKQKMKMEKKKVADIYHLNQIKRKMTKRQKRLQALKEKRLKSKAIKVLEPKQLGRHKFEPLEQEFLIGSELTGNLRSIKSAGNLLKDRYKSLQQRNIVAPGVIVLKKNKARVKKFIKADHKINLTNVKK